MQTLGSPASVVAAILEDAEAEVERLRETTRIELDAIAAAARTAHVAVEDRDARLAAERQRNEERVAKQEWDGRRAAIEQREAWLQSVVAKAQETWGSRDRAQLLALIDEARKRLPSGHCEIAVSARDRDLAPPDATVVTAPIAGGCVVTIGDVSFDNSFEARARRLESEWRTALSGMYAP